MSPHPTRVRAVNKFVEPPVPAAPKLNVVPNIKTDVVKKELSSVIKDGGSDIAKAFVFEDFMPHHVPCFEIVGYVLCGVVVVMVLIRVYVHARST